MSFQFAGFFATPVLSPPPSLPPKAIWKVVETPFHGVGISLPSLTSLEPSAPKILSLMEELGLQAADRWIFLSYDTWGGDVDYVYGIGRNGDQEIGPLKESSLSLAKGSTRTLTEEAYLTLMAAFGVSQEDALNFAPFARGFWDES